VELFSVIAVFILIIACINFMNLSTAKASQRAKEVGIKKAIGAGRRVLITQYFAESLAMTLLSLLIALLAIDLLLPAFNTLTGKQLALHFDTNLLLGMGAIFVITGLIAGSYPALYLSGFNPAAVLKGKLAISWGEVWARRGLVIFQFTLSIILIVSVIVVYRQMNYIQTKNLGYSRDQVLYFDMEMPTDWDHEPPFLNDVRNIPGVLNASCFYHDLMGHHGGTSDVHWDGQGTNQVGFSSLDVGLDFIQTLGIQMAEGQAFRRDIPATNQIIFNERAIRSMGLKDPVGKKIKLWGEEKQIVGVARDFHFASLYEQVGSCFITVHPALPNVIVKIAAGKEQETIAALEQAHRAYSPGIPLDFKFIDEKYQSLYASEHRVSILSRYFAGVAILISCLGLFGLATFTAERRTKEIGIRKILGSSNINIVMLLSGDFTKMVLIAILIASPVSYFIVQRWLQHFVYRTDIVLWHFVASGVLALIIAWLTVGLQTFKAARVNPVKSLKEQ
jgi:putative ABC transport system permease protein